MGTLEQQLAETLGIADMQRRLSVIETTGTRDATTAETLARLTTTSESVCERITALETVKPLTIAITRDDRATVQVSDAHKVLPALLERINAGLTNVWLTGPAGSGKTSLAKHAAKALSSSHTIFPLSGGTSEAQLFGRMLPTGYAASSFVRAYTQGGVFIADECDNADPNVLTVLNGAIDADDFANPVNGEVCVKHPDFVFIACANTYGTGPDALYVGRNQLDSAFLDRFTQAQIEVDYDTALEASIARAYIGARADALCNYVWDVRRKTQENRLRRLVTTRTVKNAAARMAKGLTLDAAKESVFFGWTAEERRKVA